MLTLQFNLGAAHWNQRGLKKATGDVERLGQNKRAEHPIKHGQREKPRDGLVAVDHGVVAQVEAVNHAPEPAEDAVLDERRPALEGPVLDGVENFVERNGERDRGEAAEEPGDRGRQRLQHNQERREQDGEDRQRIPREERRLALLRSRDRVDVFDIRHLAARRGVALADAGERVVERVLLVEAAEEPLLTRGLVPRSDSNPTY